MGAQVTISVDNDGNVLRDPAQLAVARSAAVEFVSVHPNFVVTAKSRSPFNGVVYQGRNGTTGQITVRADAEAGNYQTAVAVNREGLIHIGDGPTIIVQ